MKLIETTEELSDFCLYASKFDFVTIDTEFLREKTYYSKLCLVQMAVDSNDPCSAVIIDVLSPNLNLEPLNKLLININIIKDCTKGNDSIANLFMIKVLPKH